MSVRNSNSNHKSTPSVTWPINKFLYELSSLKPVPGGGSAAALAGTLGCGVGSMVCRILIARRKMGSTSRRKTSSSLRDLEQLSRKLSGLVREDAVAYDQLVEAFHRKNGLARAKERAIRTPLEIGEAAVRAVRRMASLGQLAGPYLTSDLKAGQALLEGAFLAASAMVEVNLQFFGLPLKSRAYRKRLTLLKRRISE